MLLFRSDCQDKIKKYPGAKYRKFETEADAWKFVTEKTPQKVANSSDFDVLPKTPTAPTDIQTPESSRHTRICIPVGQCASDVLRSTEESEMKSIVENINLELGKLVHITNTIGARVQTKMNSSGMMNAVEMKVIIQNMQTELKRLDSCIGW